MSTCFKDLKIGQAVQGMNAKNATQCHVKKFFDGEIGAFDNRFRLHEVVSY